MSVEGYWWRLYSNFCSEPQKFYRLRRDLDMDGWRDAVWSGLPSIGYVSGRCSDRVCVVAFSAMDAARGSVLGVFRGVGEEALDSLEIAKTGWMCLGVEYEQFKKNSKLVY